MGTEQSKATGDSDKSASAQFPSHTTTTTVNISEGIGDKTSSCISEDENTTCIKTKEGGPLSPSTSNRAVRISHSPGDMSVGSIRSVQSTTTVKEEEFLDETQSLLKLMTKTIVKSKMSIV